MGKYDEYKQRILQCSAWLCRQGYFGTLFGTGGNVSMRVGNEDLLLITPSSQKYETLEPDDVCVIDFNMKQIEGRLAPPVENDLVK